MIAGTLAPRLLFGRPGDELVWLVGLGLLGTPIVARTVAGLFRGVFAADVVASLALLGAVLLQQPLAGLLIVLMQTGGEALEGYAARRASRAVADLEAQAPRIAHRITGSGAVEDVAVGTVAVGDRLLVRPGEMVPCDGVLVGDVATLDTSRITGEPLPRTVGDGDALSSGMLVVDAALTMRATASAARSLYHQVVELVRTAEASKAPLQRMADRAAVWFTPVTLVICAIAWVASGDPIRVLAVLVVATPCPLILAAPVAMLGGINRSAKHQIVVRHGGALEALASANAVVFDKTGTLTLGKPIVADVKVLPPYELTTLLALVAAVERGAGHLLARSVSAHAEAVLDRSVPNAAWIRESPGRGVTGLVEDRRVVVGAMSLLREHAPAAATAFEEAARAVGLRAFVAVDGDAAGWIEFSDRLRDSAAPMMRGLADLGIDRIVMLSGDHAENARSVGASLSISDVRSDLFPADKVRCVEELAKSYRVLMVGDGANDAPALASARVGMALASQGGGISAEAADVVLLIEDLTRIPESIAIARRTVAIAWQSIGFGLGLSGLAMVFAALGYLSPIVGALLQEGIDVAVILNALRVLSPGKEEFRLHDLERGDAGPLPALTDDSPAPPSGGHPAVVRHSSR
jgi:heavy metal translocating P-type ATPase